MQNQTNDLIIDFLDTESVQFVNPYEIHPILDANMATMPVTNELLQTFGPEKLDRGELFPEIQEDMKPVIKMEQFSVLSDLLLTTPTEHTSNDSIDELTTPDFDKGPFNYLSYNPTEVNKFKYVQNNNSVKTENTGTLYASEDNINFNDLNTVKNLLGIPETEMLLDQNAYVQEGINLNNLSITDSKIIRESNNVFNFDDFIKTTANTEVINVVEDFNTNMYTPANTPSYVSSPKDTSTNSYVNSPEYQSYLEEPTVIHTPEDSNGSSTELKQKIVFKISHDLPKVKVEPIPNLFSISTPDVLNHVVDLSDDFNRDFNILDLVSSEDLRALETDDDLLSTITSPSSSTPSTPAPVKQDYLKSTTTKKTRKSSYYDDDDEEYLPPTKKKTSTVCLKDIDIDEDSESDFEHEEVIVGKNVKSRGRPPKIAVVVDYKDTGVSRYRELRDKNNEASRRSRMKRKQKESELESEADELSTKNIKLKAHVEELEKMVSTFRNNLFHIMIKK